MQAKRSSRSRGHVAADESGIPVSVPSFPPVNAAQPRTAGGGARVTVVVPLYNGAENIAETLSSVQRQVHPATQVIVVDDGSTDGGAEIARRHPVNATVLSQPNCGVAVARNNGLANATGQWVAFLDQDDLWHPDHLRRALDWLHANPGERILFVHETAFSTIEDSLALGAMDPLAGAWAGIRTPRDTAMDTLIASTDFSGRGAVTRYDLRALLSGPISMTTSFIADPHLLRLAGGFAPHALAMDDYWLLVNVARLTEIPRLDQPTVFYRVHTGATSRTTRLGLPFLSSAAALRLGGGLVPVSEGLKGGFDGRLHRHLLDQLLAEPSYRDPLFRGAVDNLAKLLWPRGGYRRVRWKARAAARMPLLRKAVRAVRRR